jgi:hypothetical protein
MGVRQDEKPMVSILYRRLPFQDIAPDDAPAWSISPSHHRTEGEEMSKQRSAAQVRSDRLAAAREIATHGNRSKKDKTLAEWREK